MLPAAEVLDRQADVLLERSLDRQGLCYLLQQERLDGGAFGRRRCLGGFRRERHAVPAVLGLPLIKRALPLGLAVGLAALRLHSASSQRRLEVFRVRERQLNTRREVFDSSQVLESFVFHWSLLLSPPSGRPHRSSPRRSE